MLYKVTPMMPAPEKAKKATREGAKPRGKRKSAIYDSDGNEVLITLMCLKCRSMKPLAQFGLRKMADGAIRNQPWCRPCRSGAGAAKDKPARPEPESAQVEIEEGAAETAAPEIAAAPEEAAPVRPERTGPASGVELAVFGAPPAPGV